MKDSYRSDIFFAAALIVALYLVYQASSVLLIIYISALFAVVLEPAIGLVRKAHIGRYWPGRGVAMLVIVFSLVLLIALFLGFAAPPIFRDIQDLSNHWPEHMTAISARIHGLPGLEKYDLGKFETAGTEVVGDVFSLFRGLAGGVFGLFTGLILTAYFILDGERAFYWGLSMFPKEHRIRLQKTLLRAEQRMRHWLIGQTALMATLGTCSFIVFGLLKLKYFYALAVFAGLVNIIPIIGPVTAFTLTASVAIFDSPSKLLGVIGFFLLYQQFETGFLTPKIMKTTVDLPPLAVIVSLALGGALAGPLGALVAVPSAALCAVLIDEYLVKKDAPQLPAEEH